MSGCLLAFLIVLGVVVVAGIGAVTWLVYFVQQTAEEMQAIIEDAADADGASDMRDSGCDEAAVIDFQRFLDVFPEGLFPEADKQDVDVLAMCLVEDKKGAPSCKDVARAYFEGSDRAPVLITVQLDDDGDFQTQDGQAQTLCSQRYEDEDAL